MTEIGEAAFWDCTGLTSVTIGESVTSIDRCAFEDCTGLTQVNFNASACTYAGSRYYIAFKDCTNISKVIFGDNVTIIPDNLFFDHTRLKEVTIGNSVTTIGDYAFCNCPLTEITIPNSVTSIGSYAFDEGRFTEVTIPESVKEIGTHAFYNCSKLVGITSLNQEPPKCGSSVFYNVDTDTCILYVPYGSIGAYATRSPWSSFYNIVEIEVDAIADILTKDNAEVLGYYTTDGKQVPTLQRGINIIRYSDGTAKKVLVK